MKDLLPAREKSCMPGDENRVAVAREWIQKAENDLKNAAHTLKMGSDCPTDTVCFHALSEARRAVAIARRMRREIRRLLPRKALLRK